MKCKSPVSKGLILYELNMCLCWILTLHIWRCDFCFYRFSEDVPFWSSCRFGLAIIGFFGFLNLYAQRVNMSVAMVCMVNQTWLQEQQALTGGVEVNKALHNLSSANSSSNDGSCSLSATSSNTSEVCLPIICSMFWSRRINTLGCGWRIEYANIILCM